MRGVIIDKQPDQSKINVGSRNVWVHSDNELDLWGQGMERWNIASASGCTPPPSNLVTQYPSVPLKEPRFGIRSRSMLISKKMATFAQTVPPSLLQNGIPVPVSTFFKY